MMHRPAETDAESTVLPREECDLRACLVVEFREMPGHRLTLEQVARLFSHDSARCARALEALVDRGELATDGEAFVRPEADARVPPHLW
jgi:hypothetical protein